MDGSFTNETGIVGEVSHLRSEILMKNLFSTNISLLTERGNQHCSVDAHIASLRYYSAIQIAFAESKCIFIDGKFSLAIFFILLSELLLTVVYNFSAFS